MTTHYATQPIPNPMSYWVRQHVSCTPRANPASCNQLCNLRGLACADMHPAAMIQMHFLPADMHAVETAMVFVEQLCPLAFYFFAQLLKLPARPPFLPYANRFCRLSDRTHVTLWWNLGIEQLKLLGKFQKHAIFFSWGTERSSRAGHKWTLRIPDLKI